MFDKASVLRKLPLQRQLDESQWWPAERLRANQFQQLNLLLGHAYDTVPFMRRRLGAAGYLAGKAVDYAEWLNLPILTRAELQSHARDLISTRIPANHGVVHEKLTSGSTGMPVLAVGTALSTHLHNAITLRYHLWHQHDFAKKFAIIKKFRAAASAYPDGIDSSRWGDEATFPFATGPAFGLTIESSLAQQIEWLQRKQPDYLLTYPSNLAALIDACTDTLTTGARANKSGCLQFLQGVVTIGELLSEETRQRCALELHLPLADIYSAQEAGYIATQCPDTAAYHIQGEVVFVEILDNDDQPCQPGETGRVVVTPLHNYAMPLIRYDIGDYAVAGDACPCGRGLPVIRRIMGRVRNMLVLADGRRFWPSFGTRKFTEIAPIRQFQFVQKSFTRLEARLVVARPLTVQEESALSENILSRLPERFTLKLLYVDSIARSVGGKFEDFRCEIKTSNTRGNDTGSDA